MITVVDIPEPPHLWANWPPLTIAIAATAKAASIATTAKTVPQMGIFLRSGIAIIAAKQVAIAFQSHFCRFWRSILRNVASSTALWVHLPIPRKFASFTLSKSLEPCPWPIATVSPTIRIPPETLVLAKNAREPSLAERLRLRAASAERF